MTTIQVRCLSLVHRLRVKYGNDKEKNAMLDRIVWYSFPVVFCHESMSEAQKVYDSRKQQKYRCDKKLKQMACNYDHLFFVTLTFTDDTMQRLSERTRHRYVAETLNLADDYVANVDYGAKTQREHYHAVIASDKTLNQEIRLKWQKYGFIHIKPVVKRTVFTKKKESKLASYMVKLSYHATKLTAGRVFSKVKPKVKPFGFVEWPDDAELPF